MEITNNHLGTPLVPLQNDIHILSQVQTYFPLYISFQQERLLFLQLSLAPEYSFTCGNICGKVILFIYHALKLPAGILLIAWGQQLPWAFTISIYSFLALLFMCAGVILWNRARKYVYRKAILESEISAVKQLLKVQTILTYLYRIQFL